MGGLGEDLKQWTRPLLYDVSAAKSNVWAALGLAVALFLAYLIAQLVFTMIIGAMLFGSVTDQQTATKAMIISALPAALAVGGLAWLLAGVGGTDPRVVLALRRPQLTWLGWSLVIGGFVTAVHVLIMLVVVLFGIDLAQYTPNADGSSPETGSAGLVKEAMFALVSKPLHYALAFLSVSIGAPLAEELVFRGQLFSALSRSWFGKSGAVLITTGLWSLMHVSEPWLTVGLIFGMGLVLGWLLLRFGSLYVTMACHAAWNAIYSAYIFGNLSS